MPETEPETNARWAMWTTFLVAVLVVVNVAIWMTLLLGG